MTVPNYRNIITQADSSPLSLPFKGSQKPGTDTSPVYLKNDSFLDYLPSSHNFGQGSFWVVERLPTREGNIEARDASNL
jgi:hypothetical protein